MVSGDSADVWARQHEFRVDASVGVPPDAFSETGQDWGLPAYRWDVHRGERLRVAAAARRRCAELFDGFRVDHLVGFYRTFVREQDGATALRPARRTGAARAGRAAADRCSSERGGFIIAEDLGIVPDFVRESLDRLGIPGLKCCAGSATGRRTAKPFMDPAGVSRGVGRDQRHARHRDDGGVVGRTRTPTSAQPCWLCRSSRAAGISAGRAVLRPGARRAARVALRRRLRPAARPRPGHLRLARPHQRPRRRQRRQLVLAAALAASIASRDRTRGRRRAPATCAASPGTPADPVKSSDGQRRIQRIL